MNRRTFLIALSVLAAFVVLAWLLLTGSDPIDLASQQGIGPSIPTPTPAPEQRIVLLFAGTDGRLHPELREVPLPAEVHQRARIVITELLAGPTGDLAAVVPYPAELNGVFIGENSVAFVDITPPPEGLEGSHIELMLVYGVVNSVLLNCPELTAVQLLFGGSGIPTLTGHLDLSRPLVLNKRLIAAS
jgi:germination protein M